MCACVCVCVFVQAGSLVSRASRLCDLLVFVRTWISTSHRVVSSVCVCVSRTPFDVLNTATGNGATPLHMAVNNAGGNVALIKAGSAALRCSGGPAGATFDEEGKPVRHSGGGDSGRGRAGRWLGGQGRVGGRDVRLWGESSWCCSSRGPSGKTGNTYSQMSIVVVQSWMRCIWSICLVAKSGVLELVK